MQLALNLKRATQVVSGPIAKAAISGLALRLIGMALLFAQAVLAARFLGAEQYGIVSILLALAHIAAAVVLCGFGSFAVAEIPQRLQRNLSHAVPAFVRHAIKRMAMTSAIVLPATAIALAVMIGPVSPMIFALVLVSVPVLAALQLFRGVALGLERPIAAQFPSEILRPALLLAALVALWFFAAVDTSAFLLIYVATAAIAALIALPSIKTRPAADDADRDDSTLGSQWDRAALPFLAIQLAAILQVELATIMLAVFASAEAVGLFQPIARLAVVLLLPAYALNLRFSPRIAALHSAGKHEDVVRLSRKYTLASTLIVGATGTALAIAGPWLLLLFGPEFGVGAPLIWIVVAGRIALSAMGPGGLLLTMTNHSNSALKATGISLLIEAILAASLTATFGLTGAGVAVGIGLIVRGILSVRASKAVLNIGLVDFWRAPRSN